MATGLAAVVVVGLVFVFFVFLLPPFISFFSFPMSQRKSCSICEGTPVECYCATCRQQLCQACAGIHNRLGATKGHPTTSVGDKRVSKAVSEDDDDDEDDEDDEDEDEEDEDEDEDEDDEDDEDEDEDDEDDDGDYGEGLKSPLTAAARHGGGGSEKDKLARAALKALVHKVSQSSFPAITRTIIKKYE